MKCRKEYLKKYYQENKESLKEYGKTWREENKEYHKEYHKEYGKTWREENRERRKEYKKTWNERNKEKVIYKITFNSIIIYIGSTVFLNRRISFHKNQSYKISSDTILYKFIRENIPSEELSSCFKVLEVLNINTSIEDLRIREQHYIDLHQPILNERKAIIHPSLGEYSEYIQ